MTNDERIERINEKVEALGEKIHNLETDIRIITISTEHMSKSLDKLVSWRDEEREKGNKTITKTGWLVFGGIITSIFSIVIALVANLFGV